MKRQFIIITILFSLLSCTKEESESKVVEASAGGHHSIPAKETIPSETEEQNNETYVEPDETVLYFIVSVAEGYNYDSLQTIALNTAKILNFRYDTLGRYYHPQKGIILPENDEDEVWAGEYFFRRVEDNFVSIEMRYAYIDTAIVNNDTEREKLASDTSKMFVFAMMYPEKKSADSLASVIKTSYPNTKVIASEIFMGCMH